LSGPGRATKIRLRDFRSPPMRAFHLSWFAFFLCFFGWFGVAPLMAAVRDDLGLTREQVGNTVIASVLVTIFARLVIGWLCDRIGPRLAYTGLLLLGSIPVMAIGFAQSYEGFLLGRLAIGVIGASFVITQAHTSMMFAPNCVGTANATTAGWGNTGGGATQLVMPLIFAAILTFGATQATAWRLAMIVPGVLMILTGIAYFFLTQDTPAGNLADLRRAGRLPDRARGKGAFAAAIRDPRVLVLFLIYGACFGVELTINNICALYLHDEFGLGLAAAGGLAALFGMMNLFARSLGGFLGDRAGGRFGLRGRAALLGVVLFGEGLLLMVFSQMELLAVAIVTLVIFSLFVQMAEGVTFSVVPFINRDAVGAVSGIVGAGGNAGAVAAGFLLRTEGLTTRAALLYLGLAVATTSVTVLALRFSRSSEREAHDDIRQSLAAAST
jgi:NNP family nitrate/nitrite transporter-like MFS transporter